MSGGHYAAKHLHPAPPTPRSVWARPMLAATLALGMAGVVVLRPTIGSGPGEGAPPTSVAPSVEGEAISLCTRASLEDRAALVLVVGLPGVTAADDPLVDRLAAVGVAGVMLRDENIVDEDQVTDLVDGLRQRLGPDLLVAVDDEGGRVSSMRALGQSVTSARRLGQRGAEAARDAGEDLGELAGSVGIDWAFAPVADLDDGPASGVIGDRSFGSEPAEVATTAGAFAAGLHQAGMAVTVKHFPGHGGDGDPHRGDTVDTTSVEELRAEDLVPFEALVHEGAEAVMVGHVSYPTIWGDRPASLEAGAYELLRDLGFEGVAITDALGMGAVHARFGFDRAPAMAVAAGADAVLVTQGDQVDVLHAGLVEAVLDGRLDEARLDEAVRRVLTLRGQPPDGIVCPTA
jgi:beta-N-acetylhexosaminidase